MIFRLTVKKKNTLKDIIVYIICPLCTCHVVTMSMQNRCTVKPFTLAGPTASLALSPSSPSPVLTLQGQQLAGRPVFLSCYACLPLAAPLAAVSQPQPITARLRLPQRPDRAVSSLRTGSKRSSRETCLFVVREIEQSER